jgi:hypothetical protein
VWLKGQSAYIKAKYINRDFNLNPFKLYGEWKNKKHQFNHAHLKRNEMKTKKERNEQLSCCSS